MISEKQPNELDKQPYFLRDTADLRRKLNHEIAQLEQMTKAGYTETADGQNIGTLVSVRKTFLRRIEDDGRAAGARW